MLRSRFFEIWKIRTSDEFVSRGGGFGVIGDIALGIVGAVVGAWGIRQLGWHSPIRGLPGTIFVAFLGAVVVLFAIRLVQRTRAGRP